MNFRGLLIAPSSIVIIAAIATTLINITLWTVPWAKDRRSCLFVDPSLFERKSIHDPSNKEAVYSFNSIDYGAEDGQVIGYKTNSGKLLHVGSYNKGPEPYSIPKILHFTWKNDTLPPKYAKYRQAWLDMHPGWAHHLWTDVTNRLLVEKHYPWLLEVYDIFPVGVMRADLVRYLFVHRYGGLYVDLDMEPLRPLDFLIDEATTPVTLGYMRDEYTSEDNVPPGFLLSAPGHPLWMAVVNEILVAVNYCSVFARPDYVTGPIRFYHVLERYAELHNNLTRRRGDFPSVSSGSNYLYDVKILPPGLIYPYHWSQGSEPIGLLCAGGRDETACKAKFPDAYTVQYSGYSWGKDWEGFLASYNVTEFACKK